MTRTSIHRIEADGLKVFYRQAEHPIVPWCSCSTAFLPRPFNTVS